MKKETIKENVEDIVYQFIIEVDQPFVIDNILDNTSIRATNENIRRIFLFLRSEESVVEENGRFFPKAFFLNDIPIRVQPMEWEIKEGIWIPGHRLLPFYPLLIPQGDVSFTIKDSGEKIKAKTIAMKMEELHIYFSLMDMQKIPFENMDDLLEKNADMKFKACQMKEFYLRYNFQLGDTFIIRPVDILKGQFTIEYDSMDSIQTHIFEIQRLDKTFISTLKDVLKKKLWYPNLEKQLLYTYYALKQSKFYKWDIPGTALGPLLAVNPDITFSMLHNGRTIFHFSNQTLDDLDIYPTFAEITDDMEKNAGYRDVDDDMEDDIDDDMDSIGGILHFLENTNTHIIVRALLFEMITEQKRFNYAKIEDYLFFGLAKPGMPPDLKRRFRALVQEEYKQIKKDFDLKYAFLPITTARHKILEQNTIIVQFLFSLEMIIEDVYDLPKNDLIQLYELHHGFQEILQDLDDAQMTAQCDMLMVHKIVKMVDIVTESLPILFQSIREKIGGDE